jgi:uncharacterized protein YkwD
VPHRLQVLTALVIAALSAVGALAHPPVAGAATCARAHAIPGEASRTQLAHAVVCVTNAERRGHGLRKLKLNRRLATAARDHSLDMVRRGYFAHTAPSGETFEQRIRAAGYLNSARRWLVGENLGWGWGASASPRGIVKAWMRSPEHRKILLRPSYQEVGIGVAFGGPRRQVESQATFTADFGVIG